MIGVRKLWCEGEDENKLDPKLLRALTQGLKIEVEHDFSRHGMGTKIKARRKIESGHYGLIDGDFYAPSAFDEEFDFGKPQIWKSSDDEKATFFGWRWSRKEIENYLIDASVLHHCGVITASQAGVLTELTKVVSKGMVLHQALRFTLSHIREKPHVKKRPFPIDTAITLFPDNEGIAHAKSLLVKRISEYSENIIPVVEEAEGLLEQNAELLNNHEEIWPYIFAGKDLVTALNIACEDNGLPTANALIGEFIERIEKIEGEKIASWLPEWQKLREYIKDPEASFPEATANPS